jgi:hypothetical protein
VPDILLQVCCHAACAFSNSQVHWLHVPLFILFLQVSSFGDHPMLQPAAARLANAMIAVLGNDFTLGSAAYSRCKTLVTDNSGSLSAAAAAAAAAAAGGGGAGGASSAVPVAAGSAEGLKGLAVTWAELEQVKMKLLICLTSSGLLMFRA